MRFGQNAVRTPGRTHVNDCVTKGVKFRSSLFKGLQVQGGALVARRNGRNSFASFRRAHFSLLTFFLKEKKKVDRRSRARRGVAPLGLA